MEFVKKCWRRHLVINAIVCTLSFAFSLPISLALFPQQSKVFFFFFFQFIIIFSETSLSQIIHIIFLILKTLIISSLV